MESNSTIPPEAEARNWLELPAEVMSTILLKLGAIEILVNAQSVCSSWRKICKDPPMWRIVDMHNLHGVYDVEYDLETMCRHAVDRSCGQLVDINIEHFGTDELLQYISGSSNELRRLRIVNCYDISDEGLNEAVSTLPLLEHLEIYNCSFYVKTLKTVGRCCPLLKSVKLIKQFCRGMGGDGEALAIAETMPKLRHLQLLGNHLTNRGLQAILDGCPELESLDLRQCFNLNLAGQLEKVCAERIQILHLPHDPTNGYGYEVIDDETNFWDDDCDYNSEYEDYSFGFPDIGSVFSTDEDDDEDYSRFLVDRDCLDYDDFTRWY